MYILYNIIAAHENVTCQEDERTMNHKVWNASKFIIERHSIRERQSPERIFKYCHLCSLVTHSYRCTGRRMGRCMGRDIILYLSEFFIFVSRGSQHAVELVSLPMQFQSVIRQMTHYITYNCSWCRGWLPPLSTRWRDYICCRNWLYNISPDLTRWRHYSCLYIILTDTPKVEHADKVAIYELLRIYTGE